MQNYFSHKNYGRRKIYILLKKETFLAPLISAIYGSKFIYITENTRINFALRTKKRAKIFEIISYYLKSKVYRDA